jgi:hypothetical protein
MENIYMISYDIHTTKTENHDKTSRRVEDLFKELSLSDDGFALCASTTWLLKTSLSAEQVAMKLHKAMNKSGNVVVAKIAGDSAIIGDDDIIIKSLLDDAKKERVNC